MQWNFLGIIWNLLGSLIKCRKFIFLDGSLIGREFHGSSLDANDTICPTSFSKGTEENMDTWAEFIVQLNKVLMFNAGEGFCVVSDGKNG